jgi:hypothetical protein
MRLDSDWEEWRPSRTSRIVNGLAAVVCTALVITLVIGIATAGSGADVLGASVLAACLAMVAIINVVEAFRLRLAVGPEGLVVRNLRTTEIPWSEFQDCSAGAWGLRIRRAGHRPVVALAVDKAPVDWLSERTSADVVVSAIGHYAQQHAA